MEFFGLHIPQFVVTAAVALYWVAVAVCLLACVMKRWLWGTGTWYLLALGGAYAVSASLELSSASQVASMIFAFILILGKWKKVAFTPAEWLTMAVLAYPLFMVMFYILLIVWVEAFRLPL